MPAEPEAIVPIVAEPAEDDCRVNGLVLVLAMFEFVPVRLITEVGPQVKVPLSLLVIYEGLPERLITAPEFRLTVPVSLLMMLAFAPAFTTVPLLILNVPEFEPIAVNDVALPKVKVHELALKVPPSAYASAMGPLRENIHEVVLIVPALACITGLVPGKLNVQLVAVITPPLCASIFACSEAVGAPVRPYRFVIELLVNVTLPVTCNIPAVYKLLVPLMEKVPVPAIVKMLALLV